MKIEVNDASQNPIQVEMGRVEFDALGAAVGERLYLKPKRVRVFTADRRQKAR